MIKKIPIFEQRIRKTPSHFSWLDQRLVQNHLIDLCSHSSAALYLFLVTVSDSLGLSYYADASITSRLNMDADTLIESRNELVQIGLIAYHKPLYQVLSLEEV